MLKAMSLRGALSTMSAEDVLEWAARRKLRRRSTFERRGPRAQPGRRGRRDRVGELEPPRRAARRDPRGERRWSPSARSPMRSRRARETGVPLGKVLLMSGLITEADLVEILATKIRETVTDVITWTRRAVRRRGRAPSRRDRRSSRAAVDRRLPHRRAPPRRADGRDHGRSSAPTTSRSTCRRRATDAAGDRAAPIDAARVWALAGDRRHRRRHRRVVLGRAVRDATTRSSQLVQAGRARDRSPPARAHELRVELAPARAAGCARAIARGARDGRAGAPLRIRAIRRSRKTFTQAERARVAEVAKQLLAQHRVPRLREPRRDRRARISTPRSSSPVPRRRPLGPALALIRPSSIREAEALLAFAHLAELGVVELRRRDVYHGSAGRVRCDDRIRPSARLLPRSGIGVDGAVARHRAARQSDHPARRAAARSRRADRTLADRAARRVGARDRRRGRRSGSR